MKIYLAAIFFLLFLTTAHGDVAFFTDGLFFQASETCDWAFTVESNENTTSSNYKTFAFNWSPGLRIGLNYIIDNSCFDICSSYAFLEAKATGQAEGAVTPGFLGARLSLLEPFASANGSLKINYNILLLETGYTTCYHKLSLRTALGLKGGFINQKIDTSFEKTIDTVLIQASENLTQKFTGVGPMGSIKIKYPIMNNCLHLVSLFDAGYLWGYWSIKDRYVDSLETVITVDTSDRKFGAFVTHGFLGFELEKAIFHNPSFLNIRLIYEIENWFNHLQVFSDISGSQNNNLIIQGVTLRLSMAF